MKRRWIFILSLLSAAILLTGYDCDRDIGVDTSGDIEPPSKVENLRAKADYQSILVQWDRNEEDDIAGYDIYRSKYSNIGHTKINDELVPNAVYPQFHDTHGLERETIYYYTVNAVDKAGNVSESSDEVSAQLVGYVTSLIVNSLPESALIYLNGVNTGYLTNHTFPIDPRAAGTYRVKVTREGYLDSDSKEVIVTKGDSTSVLFVLNKIPTQLTLTSSPEGATIYMSGTSTGQVTPYTFSDIEPGTYEITVSLDGYEPVEPDSVKVAEGVTTTHNFVLEPLPTILEVRSVPSGASIFLDNEATNEVTNYIFTEIEPGFYWVTVALEGYEAPNPEYVEVKRGGEHVVEFDLVQQPTLRVVSEPSGAEIFIDGVSTNKYTPYTFYNYIETYNFTESTVVTVEHPDYGEAEPQLNTDQIDDETTEYSFSWTQ